LRMDARAGVRSPHTVADERLAGFGVGVRVAHSWRSSSAESEEVMKKLIAIIALCCVVLPADAQLLRRIFGGGQQNCGPAGCAVQPAPDFERVQAPVDQKPVEQVKKHVCKCEECDCIEGDACFP